MNHVVLLTQIFVSLSGVLEDHSADYKGFCTTDRIDTGSPKAGDMGFVCRWGIESITGAGLTTACSRPNGRPFYCRVLIRVNGKQQWRTFPKKKDAEDYLDTNSTNIRNGTFKQIKPTTFGKYIAQWKDTYLIPGTIDDGGNLTTKRHKPSTIRGYRTIIDQYLKPEFEHMPMQAVTADKIRALESKLLQKLSTKTVHNALTLLGKILEDARKDGYLKVSPMVDVQKTKFICKEKRALKGEEAQQLLAKSSGSIKLMIMIMLLAGLRRAELFALRWTDIDFDHDQIHVRRAVEWLSRKHGQVAADQNAFVFVPPKYHSIRAVDMSPALKAELREARMKAADKEGLIFHTENGTPLQPSNVYKRWFQPVVKAAGIGDLDMHDLRHTFGSWKIEQGEDVIYVSKQMGHKKPDITFRVYSHLTKGAARKPQPRQTPCYSRHRQQLQPQPLRA